METSTESTVQAPTVLTAIDITPDARPHPALKAPWKKGQSGNPAGRRAQALPSKAKLQEALAAALKGGRLDELMSAWVQHAIDGNPGYLNAILQRLWPVDVQEQRSPLILSGIKLELGPEGATITMGQSQLPQAQDVTVTGSLSSDRREPEIVGVPGGGSPGEISEVASPTSSPEISTGNVDTTTTP